MSSKIAFYKKEIADLKKEKLSKQAIIVAQSPTASQHPIKPKKMRNVMLAIFIGIFMMVLLSFLLEYLSRKTVRKLQ